MKSVAESICVLLVLALLVSVGLSCGPAITAVPTKVQTTLPPTAPEASLTDARVAVATPTPRPAHTQEPTAAPTADAVGTATSPDQVPRITVEELKALMDSGARTVVLDNRPRESFQMEHIQGAISFPWQPQLTIGDLELLPLRANIVTYCDCGPGEADSADVALQLIELGYEGDVKVLAHPAIEGWMELGYPTQ